MSVTKIVSMMGAAGAITMGFWNMILPNKPPVEIHALSYANGTVTTEATFRGDGEANVVIWSGQVIDAATNEVIPGCEGTRLRQVAFGHNKISLPMDQWVNSVGCLMAAIPENTDIYLRWTLSSTWQDGGDDIRSETIRVSR